MSTAQASTPPPPEIRRAAVLYHPKIEETRGVAGEISDWLAARGVEAWMGLTWEEAEVRPRIPEQNVLIVLGGDGSMLRAARMSAEYGVPILGVNMGRLGFLSEMGPTNWRERLPNVLSGRYWIEERMMLHAESWRDSQQMGRHIALNDVVISRGTLARVIRLRTEIDGEKLTTYIADGLILATPTGSTAYALAAGGPILPPELRNILVIPIAPHLTLNRAFVLSEGSTVRVQITTDHQATLTVDGQFEFELQSGDFVDICASKHTSRFVRLNTRNTFYQTLLARLEPKQADEED